MRQALIEKGTGEIYFSSVGELMMLNAAIKNEGLLLVGEDDFYDSSEARKVSIEITSFQKIHGAFFQVVLEERGSVVWAKTYQSYWYALRDWYQWSGLWSPVAYEFFKGVVGLDEKTPS